MGHQVTRLTAALLFASLAPGIRGLAQCSPDTLGVLAPPEFHDWSWPAFALEGDTAIVGSPLVDIQTGIVYVYHRGPGGAFTPQQELHPHDAYILDDFGSDVAIEGDILIIGADHWDQQGGAVYAFERDPNGVWTERAEIGPQDQDCDYSFADSVALSGQRALVSAVEHCGGGAVYVIARAQDGTWSVEDTLHPSDGDDISYFGQYLSIAGDSAAVGSQTLFIHAHGRAYVYARADNGAWSEEAIIEPPPTPGLLCVGADVLLAADRLLVTARYQADQDDPGIVRLFIYSHDPINGWTLEDEVVADDFDPNALYAAQVAFYADLLLLGLPEDDLFGAGVGSVRAFRPDAQGHWFESGAFIPDGFEGGTSFGTQVVRAPGGHQAGILGFHPGPDDFALYDMDLASCSPGCFADFDTDGTLTLFDFLAFVNAFNADDPAADCDHSQSLDLFDFLCFTNSFNAGC